jgi:hypothetical protein
MGNDLLHLVPVRSGPPRDRDSNGERRRVGVEIELGGLSEEQVAETVRHCLGGEIDRGSRHELHVRGTELGDIEVCLDTAYKDSGNPAIEKAVELGRGLIPVEIVTKPIPFEAMGRLDELVDRIREAGGAGTRDRLLNGYGVHFNVSVVSLDAEGIVPVVRAFALIEDWLRADVAVDLARRVLPFVERYPRAFVDAIAREGAGWSLEDLMTAYLALTPTRNRSLDMLPILREIDEERVVAALGDAARAVTARPAYHYRLPDSRIGDPHWSLALEWSRWSLVEHVAARPDLLDGLSRSWLEYRNALTTTPSDWLARSGGMLEGSFCPERTA